MEEGLFTNDIRFQHGLFELCRLLSDRKVRFHDYVEPLWYVNTLLCQLTGESKIILTCGCI